VNLRSLRSTQLLRRIRDGARRQPLMVSNGRSPLKSKRDAVRMRSYALEIKGIAGPGILNNHLPGGTCVRKLHPRQPGSKLGEGQYSQCKGSASGLPLPRLVRKPDIINDADSTRHIMKQRENFGVFLRRKLARESQGVSGNTQFHFTCQRNTRQLRSQSGF